MSHRAFSENLIEDGAKWHNLKPTSSKSVRGEKVNSHLSPPEVFVKLKIERCNSSNVKD